MKIVGGGDGCLCVIGSVGCGGDVRCVLWRGGKEVVKGDVLGRVGGEGWCE